MHFCFARHTIAQVFLVFFLLGFAVVVGRTNVLQVFYREGDGHTCCIVGVNYAEVFRKAEQYASLFRTSGQVIEGEGAFLFGIRADEERGEGFFAFVELCQHGFQLFAVFGVEISLSLDELISVFADVENLCGGQLCASCGAAGAEHVGRFVTVGVERRRGDGAHAGLRQCCRLRGFGVHCEEETLRRQRHERGRSAVIEPNGVGRRAVGRAKGIYLHPFQCPGVERIEHHVLAIE